MPCLCSGTTHGGPGTGLLLQRLHHVRQTRVLAPQVVERTLALLLGQLLMEGEGKGM